MAAKKKKRKSAFRRGLHSYLSLLFFFTGFALVLLWFFLARYQAGLDADAARQASEEKSAAHELAVQRAPQLCFESFLRQADGEYWARQWFASHPKSLDDPDRVAQYMDTLFSGPDLHCWKKSDYTDEHPRFVLKNQDQDLAYITLSGRELDWRVTDVELMIEGHEKASLFVPEGYQVTCNGHVLDSSFCEAETRLFDMEDYADLIVNPIHWETYSLVDQLFPPDIVAQAPTDRQLLTDDDGVVYYILSDDEAAAYQERAEYFIYKLLYYYMSGNVATAANLNAVLNLVAYNSQAYNLVLNSYDGVTWDPYNYNVTYSEDAGPVRVLADNCLMVDVAYHAEGIGNGVPNIADGTYRVYFLDTGRGFSIYGLAYV